MRFKDEGIVLRVTKYRNTSLIGDVMSKEHGLLTLVLKGGGSKSNRSKSILFAAPNIVYFECTPGKSGQTAYINEMSPEIYYKTLPFNIRKSSVAIFLNEVMIKVCKVSEPQDDLYQFLKCQLVKLDTLTDGIGRFPNQILKKLAYFLGVQPRFKNIDAEYIFDLHEGRDTNIIPHHQLYLEKEQRKTFLRFMEETDFSYTQNENAFIFRTLLAYFTIHVPGFGVLKSPEIISKILS